MMDGEAGHGGMHGDSHDDGEDHMSDDHGAGGHESGGHHDEDNLAIGEPGDAAAASRTIEVTMIETSDGGMAFEPTAITVKAGETVRLSIRNGGELEHEFVMNVPSEIEEHKALMTRFPEMEHADPNAIRLAPGASGEIVWTFGEAGSFEFACLIPGHYEAGMHGTLTVAAE